MKLLAYAVTCVYLSLNGIDAESTEECFLRIRQTLNTNSLLVSDRTICFKDALNTTPQKYFETKQKDQDLDLLISNKNCMIWFEDLSVAYRMISPPCTITNTPGSFKYAVTGLSSNFNLTFQTYLKNMQKSRESHAISLSISFLVLCIILLSVY